MSLRHQSRCRSSEWTKLYLERALKNASIVPLSDRTLNVIYGDVGGVGFVTVQDVDSIEELGCLF
jgi:hypothetical protein